MHFLLHLHRLLSCAQAGNTLFPSLFNFFDPILQPYSFILFCKNTTVCVCLWMCIYKNICTICFCVDTESPNSTCSEFLLEIIHYAPKTISKIIKTQCTTIIIQRCSYWLIPKYEKKLIFITVKYLIVT